jgi:hypothetical protein
MNIQAEKLEIIRMILETDNPGILESIKKLFLKESPVDFWTSLPQEQKDEILEGLEQIDKGETVKYDDLMKKYRS